MEHGDLIAYCGVDCAVCTDFTAGKCPGCRKSFWPEGDACMPIACCQKQGISLCGECGRFPCPDMAEFYRESESHRQAGLRMRQVAKQSHAEGGTTLLIDACVRRDSRTRRLTDCLLSRLGGAVTELRLAELDFEKTDEAFLRRRDDLIAAERFDDPAFALARQFAAAERIVIAAPYWDLSFPAALKQYFEHINVLGLTFRYTPEGTPVGLCRAKRLYYVTTAGGAFVPEEFGFGYVKALAQGFYGIDDVRLLQAVGLDIDGADPEAILARAMDRAAELV